MGARDMIKAINGIGHAAVATDPEFRALLAARGFTLDAEPGRSSSPRRTSGRSTLGPVRSTGTSTGTTLSGGASIPPGTGRSCARRGIAARGPMRGRKRSPPPTALTWSLGGTPNCLPWVTATRPPPPRWRQRRRLDRPRRGGGVGDFPARGERSAWNAVDIRGRVEVLLAQANLVADPRRASSSPRTSRLGPPLAHHPAGPRGGARHRASPRPHRRYSRTVGPSSRSRLGADRPDRGGRRGHVDR